MIEQLKQLMKELVDDDEFFTISARAMMKMKNALEAQGFTEVQAMLIVVAYGFGANKN